MAYNSVSTTLKYFKILFAIFGILPVDISYPARSSVLVSYRLYTSFLIVGTLIVAYYAAKDLYYNHVLKEGDASVGELVQIFGYALNFLCHILVQLQSFLKIKVVFDITMKFDRIDDILNSSFHRASTASRSSLRMSCKYWTYFLITTGCYIHLMVFYILSSDAYISYTILYVMVTVLRSKFLQFLFYVECLAKRLRIIEKETESFRVFYMKQKPTQPNVTQVVDKLYLFGKLHEKVFDLVLSLNDYFGYSLVILFSDSLWKITSQFYWSSMAYKSSNYFDCISSFEYSLPKSWIILLTFLGGILVFATCFSDLYLVCKYCSDCVQISQSIVAVFQGLRNANKFYNKRIIAVLRLMSLQFLHETLRFTANGFFDINMEMMGGMMAASTTYLVIIFQFQMDEGN